MVADTEMTIENTLFMCWVFKMEINQTLFLCKADGFNPSKIQVLEEFVKWDEIYKERV